MFKFLGLSVGVLTNDTSLVADRIAAMACDITYTTGGGRVGCRLLEACDMESPGLTPTAAAPCWSVCRHTVVLRTAVPCVHRRAVCAVISCLSGLKFLA